RRQRRRRVVDADAAGLRAAIANAVGTGERVRLRALAQRVVQVGRAACMGRAGAADHTRAADRRQADRAGAGRDRAHIDAQGAGVQTAAGVARVRVHPIAATLLHNPTRTGACGRPDHRRQRRRRVVDADAAGLRAAIANAVGTGERVRLRALAQRVVRSQRRALVGIAAAADHTRAAARRQADRAGAGRDRAHIDAQGAGVQTAAGVARVRVHPIAATLLHNPGRTGPGRRPSHRFPYTTLFRSADAAGLRAAIANAVGTGERVRLRALAQRVVRGQRRALVGIAGAADHTRAAARRQADRAGAGRDRAHIDAQGAGVQTAAGVARV